MNPNSIYDLIGLLCFLPAKRIQQELCWVNCPDGLTESWREWLKVLEKLNLTLEAAQVGTFIINIKEGSVLWDDQVSLICGYTVNELGNGRIIDILHVVHPEDRKHVSESYTNQVKNSGILDGQYTS